GISGLRAILDEVCAALASTKMIAEPRTLCVERSPSDEVGDEVEKATIAMNRTRRLLAHKHAVVLLDDLDGEFPLRLALDALLADAHDGGMPSNDLTRRLVLVTSCHIPSPDMIQSQLALSPLAPDAALTLFAALLGRPLTTLEQGDVEMLCAVL